MSASELKRIKELVAENSELKRVYADLAIKNDAINAPLKKSPGSLRPERICETPDRTIESLS